MTPKRGKSRPGYSFSTHDRKWTFTLSQENSAWLRKLALLARSQFFDDTLVRMRAQPAEVCLAPEQRVALRDAEWYPVGRQGSGMNELSAKTNMSLRLRTCMLDNLERIAVAMEWDDSWVIGSALRLYLEGNGGDVLREAEGLASLDPGGQG